MSCSYYQFKSNDYYCTKKEDYVNSDIYWKYCRGYSYPDCPTYKEESSGGCYLTSACICAKGLPDDCYELTTLRNYRDNWLCRSESGKKIIKRYYEIAPKIVSAINEMKDSKSVWEMLYEKMVRPCVALIEQGKYQETLRLYRDMTLTLEKEYC